MWGGRGRTADRISDTGKVTHCTDGDRAYRRAIGQVAPDPAEYQAPNPDTGAIDNFMVCPSCKALGAVPSMAATADTVRSMANREAVDQTEIPTELLKPVIDSDDDEGDATDRAEAFPRYHRRPLESRRGTTEME